MHWSRHTIAFAVVRLVGGRPADFQNNKNKRTGERDRVAYIAFFRVYIGNICFVCFYFDFYSMCSSIHRPYIQVDILSTTLDFNNVCQSLFIPDISNDIHIWTRFIWHCVCMRVCACFSFSLNGQYAATISAQKRSHKWNAMSIVQFFNLLLLLIYIIVITE